MRKLTLFIILSLVVGAGCAKIEHKRKYIMLNESNGIKPICIDDKEYPLCEFKLDRGDYVLYFNLDKKNRWPGIFISAEMKDSAKGEAVIRENRNSACSSFDFGTRYTIGDRQAVRYSWRPGRGCLSNELFGEPHLADQIITFSVVNGEEGKVTLGTENLHFKSPTQKKVIYRREGEEKYIKIGRIRQEEEEIFTQTEEGTSIRVEEIFILTEQGVFKQVEVEKDAFIPTEEGTSIRVEEIFTDGF